MTDQNDDGKKSNKRRRPSVTDEAIGVGMLGEKRPLKKGAWSAVEDAILRKYVQKYGEGNWHLVQKYTGLARCQKSCRWRWFNQLRPDLKKSAFSESEKQHIAQLHAQMGNKWAQMAAQLPGRSENEIKNYCNRKTQPKSRNMPLYPSDLDSQLMSGSQLCQNMATLQPMEFQNLDLDGLASSLLPSLFDMPASSMVKQGISSNTHDFTFPTLRPSKRPRESETMSAGLDGSVSSGPIEFGQLTDYAWERIPEQIALCNQYDSDLSSTYDHQETGVLPGGHVLLNDNTSSSELSSLQYSETPPDSWCMPSFPLLSFEYVNTLIQSPPEEQMQSESRWPINSGLLDSLLYEPNSDKSLQRSFVQQDPEASISHTDAADRSFFPPLLADPNTPLGRPASSLFCESTPPISGRSSSYDPDSRWPINSGLLDSLLCEPNSDKSLQISFVQQDPEASISHTDAADRSFISPLQADPNTPLGRPASSLFSESTPPISGRSSSYDPGSDLHHEAVDQASTQQPEEKGTSEQMDFSGRNVLPGPWRSDPEKWRK